MHLYSDFVAVSLLSLIYEFKSLKTLPLRIYIPHMVPIEQIFTINVSVSLSLKSFLNLFNLLNLREHKNKKVSFGIEADS